jgi:alpha-tubulin suppressor-like RCC1 family protein
LDGGEAAADPSTAPHVARSRPRLAPHRSGNLLSWGRGSRGQLGHGDKETYTAAVRVLGPVATDGSSEWPVFSGPGRRRVVDVCAAVSHSAAVDDAGQLWVWGKMQVRRRG